ncbi:universal stress protein [Methanospirillum sp. J.3.6.1-F.2.7.3]|jgi:nucleotide-binding universal stress UspA family protein|uniref:Universal stress protein n=1 Tax=Methanospirillum purgamenti TaxID=2834276 RepID=A0A8E7AZI4_9EURY|nr:MULTISPECIES: universal stress protein [Methanospirillum]MDX8550999.1 universal stress protein [Methanospirillum hungatei]NLW76866.1 universal stress protein [Methanomicrobiales archaeon]QVV87576.1 universal stress protein [Methanospirillum sp. J.3.6.1-F.2.7.3]
MYNTILVAIDGSVISEKAFEAAIEQAKAWKAKLHAVYVVESGLFTDIPADSKLEIMYSLLEQEGNAALDKIREIAQKQNFEVTTHFEQGHAGDTILSTAEKLNADLIIMGSHGKSNIDRILIGSVSSFVVEHSKVSVLVVRS